MPETRERLPLALAELYARAPRGMRLGLEPMLAACKQFGDPQLAFDVVHVAGTNGKGSTCAMVEAMARAGGRRTGLYTSPHLARFAERIRVGGTEISDDVLAETLAAVLHRCPDLTFFEVATLTAFVAFRELKIETAVLEVGIGARLDATNVVPSPKATAVTRIAIDHADMLGDTLEKIAVEKAHVAKRGVDLIVGPMPEKVLAAIRGVAYAAGATVVEAMRDEAARRFGDAVGVNLAGAHQHENAAVAYLLGNRLGLAEDALTRGATSVRWPGRMETIVAHGCTWLLDAAHNPDGVAALAAHLAHEERPAVLLFGALADKNWQEMLTLLAPLADARVYVRPKGRAAADPEKLAELASGTAASGIAEACQMACVAAKGSRVVVAGSIYLIGEVRAHLLGLRVDPVVAL